MRKIKIINGSIKIYFYQKIAYIKATRYDLLKDLISIMIYYFLWSSILEFYEGIENFSYSEVIIYIIGVRLLAGQFNEGINIQLSLWIYNGNISNELIKPISLIFNLFARRLGQFYIYLCFRITPFLSLISLFFKDSINLKWYNILISFGCLNLSIVIMFFIEFVLGLTSVFTLSFFGLKQVKSVILSFLSGAMVPFFILPSFVKEMFELLPFSSMAAMPMYIYLGKYDLNMIGKYFTIQFLWILGLYSICQYIYKKMIMKVVIQGG